MKQSAEVTDDQISEALTMLGINLRRRLLDKGRDSFINPKETLGDLRLEMNEVEQAVQIKEPQRIMEELLDVAVGCVFGVASIKANTRAQEQKNPIQGGPK
jgi:hypothetical protein